MRSPVPPVDSADFKAWLDEMVDRYERTAFIEEDPIGVPRAFETPDDQETIGLFAALLAWGRRSVILSKLAELVDRMDGQPAHFVDRFDVDRDTRQLDGFKHRTFQPQDAVALVLAIQVARRQYGSLGTLFASGLQPDAPDIELAIQHFSDTLLTLVPETPLRTKHLARPSTGSACKRLAMYARWMTRPGPVDLGLWTHVGRHQLVLPLDVHTGRQARRLGLLTRKQDDWRAVQEVMAHLRALCPEDPSRYDFALFGLGAYDGEAIPV
ncbi:MAG: TIGR02757 family protein [Rubricoccaceae bacterium]